MATPTSEALSDSRAINGRAAQLIQTNDNGQTSRLGATQKQENTPTNPDRVTSNMRVETFAPLQIAVKETSARTIAGSHGGASVDEAESSETITDASVRAASGQGYRNPVGQSPVGGTRG